MVKYVKRGQRSISRFFFCIFQVTVVKCLAKLLIFGENKYSDILQIKVLIS